MKTHRWREVPGSFNGRARIANFRCEDCRALACDRDVDVGVREDPPSECPFVQDPEYIARFHATYGQNETCNLSELRIEMNRKLGQLGLF